MKKGGILCRFICVLGKASRLNALVDNVYVIFLSAPLVKLQQCTEASPDSSGDCVKLLDNTLGKQFVRDFNDSHFTTKHRSTKSYEIDTFYNSFPLVKRKLPTREGI